MRVSLIGMSGTGKSYWSKKFKEYGFQRWCCDELIAEELQQELIVTKDVDSSMGDWMGFPFESKYDEKEVNYLACEMKVLDTILHKLEENYENQSANIIIDTTGSVIYTGRKLLEKLRKLTCVVHLTTPLALQKRMCENYLKKRRAVVWYGHFQKEVGETYVEALRRCYPILLSSREDMYEKFAHIQIEYHKHQEKDFELKHFLSIIKNEFYP